MVQTDGLVLLPDEAASLLELEYTETGERLEEQESSVDWVYDLNIVLCICRVFTPHFTHLPTFTRV